MSRACAVAAKNMAAAVPIPPVVKPDMSAGLVGMAMAERLKARAHAKRRQADAAEDDGGGEDGGDADD